MAFADMIYFRHRLFTVAREQADAASRVTGGRQGAPKTVYKSNRRPHWPGGSSADKTAVVLPNFYHRLIPAALSMAAFFFCMLAPAAPVRAENEPPPFAEINRLLANGGYVVTSKNNLLFSRHPEQLLVPASIWKIATSLLALETLGSDFRFETRFYVDAGNNLYIKGMGDPYLISEEAALIIERLGGRISRINDIILDDSAFQLAGTADGAGTSLRAYDVANGALAVNFNTVSLKISTDGSVRSGEAQTPTLPLMRELGKGLPAGAHRINIGGNRNILRHTGELFRAFQEKAAIPGSGEIRPGVTPAHLTPVYVHQSTRPLAETIRGLLLYSNNFIANQIFLTCGASHADYPATWDKGKVALTRFLIDKKGLPPQAVQVEEGSGLSRRNQITPQAMLSVLAAFKPYAHLLPRDQGRLLKSGTLTGVYAYAGYFQGQEDLDGFVLILNQEKNHRNRLLDLLESLHRQPALMAVHAPTE
jgi:serine-type D-Ala-D-Ala carboxypeptidase/endopeptidase (penicillin-binding protein 4)